VKARLPLLLLLTLTGAVFAQHGVDDSKIDSLKSIVADVQHGEKADTTAIRLICGLARELADAGESVLARQYLVTARHMRSPGVSIPRYNAMVLRGLFDLQYWFFTDYDSCRYYAQQWVDAAPDSTDRAWAYIELGVSYSELGNHIKALECYHTAHALLQLPQADRWMLHHLHNNLGMLYADERELKKAETYFLQALQYAQASKIPAADLPELNNLSVLYIWMGRYDQALKYLALAAERLPLKKDPWSNANNVLNTGNALTLSGKPAAGLAKYRQALSMFGELKEEYKVASLHRLMAEAYRLQGRYGEAEREALLTLTWEHREGYGELAKESYAELYKIYGATHRYDKAFEYQGKYLAVIDSLNSAERRTRFGLLEKNFEIVQQEQVREKLEHENERYIALASVDRITRWSLAGGALLLGIGGLTAWGAYRRSQRQNRKIEEQAHELRQAAEVKTRFFANVSHELRTPVTLLNGMLELMQEDPAHPGNAMKMEIALSNSRRLHQMLNDVLDLSRVEASQWTLSAKPVEILSLLNRVVLAFESLIVRRNLILRYHPHGLEGIVIQIDEDKFEKIINNLIYNAIKFNREGGWVDVHADRTDKDLVITVADSGTGIPEKDLPCVFDRFYQSATTAALNAYGIGIGLSLVREFVELHGGEVSVTSRLNEGSSFIVRLPVIPGDRVTETVEAADDSIDVAFAALDEKPVVLIVEDNDEMRFYLKEILGPQVAIAEARHGREALQWLKTRKPHVIISDVMMPEMDGYAFLAHLKQSAEYRPIPVVMLTARSGEEDMLHGLSLGVDDYMVKPFNARELSIRIYNLLVNQKIRQEWRQKPPEPGDPAPEGDTAQDREFLQKIQAFVEENIGNMDLGVINLSDYLAMSERQVYRKAATLTGMTPAQLIKEIRLRLAYRLLQERQVTKVSDLAKRVGFDNATYFSKQFFQRYGKRPAEYL
jgi:signal transduction histidine kinase/DNA-binding response OmpR family regulator